MTSAQTPSNSPMNGGESHYKRFRVKGTRARGLPQHQERMRGLRTNMTPAEKLLWSMLRARKFHGMKFRRQHGIGPYIVDFYCDEAKLIIEVDGGIHRDPEIVRNDIERSNNLEALGYHIVRVTNDEAISTPTAVKERLETAFPLYSWRG